MTFPDDFWWGAGMSATTAEGAAPASDLAAWEQAGRCRPSGPGAGFFERFVDDLALLAERGLCHLRLTLEWARLEPTNGRRDDEAVDHLRSVLRAAGDAGITVWGCLHDGTLPGWFAHDERGFADARSRRYFWARHVELVGEAFGDLVGGWVPVHEPGRWAQRGWIDGARPPGRRDDAEGFAAALEGVHLASVDAAQRLRQSGQPVATAQWLVPVFGWRADPDAPVSAEAEVATGIVDEAFWGSWRRMLTEETLVVGHRPPVEVPGAREAFDVIGFTYRHAATVRGDGALGPYPQRSATGADGQVAWSEGLALALHHMAESLPGRPLLVAGYGLTTGDEDHRERYLRDGLAIAADAVADGIDLRGFWWDAPVGSAPDGSGGPNGEGAGAGGEGAGAGLFARDRTPRPAAALLSSVTHGGAVPA
ncbi:family 1 glycosylhydrolase [soil metagenome]